MELLGRDALCPLPESASRWEGRTCKQLPALPGGKEAATHFPNLSTSSPLFFLLFLQTPPAFATFFSKGFKFCLTLIRESVPPGTWGLPSLPGWSPPHTGLPWRKIQDCPHCSLWPANVPPPCILVSPAPPDPHAMTVLGLQIASGFKLFFYVL